MEGEGGGEEGVARALAGGTAPPSLRRQLYEVLAALCVSGATGHQKALTALARAQQLSGARHPLGPLVTELKQSPHDPAHKTALLAFINCLIVAATSRHQRQALRDTFVALGLLSGLKELKSVAENCPELGVQLDVFAEQRDSDEAISTSLDLSCHYEVFIALMKQVGTSDHESQFLSILQHLLRADTKEQLADTVWSTAETLVHRATLLESREHAQRLLQAPAPPAPCAPCSQSSTPRRRLSLPRALSPPPNPPPAPPIPPAPPVSAPLMPVPPAPPPPCAPIPPAPPVALPATTPAVAPPPALDHIRLPQQDTPVPRTKMKTINWNKIPNSKVVGRNNVWSLVAARHRCNAKDESKTGFSNDVSLDWEELEGLFCQHAPTSAPSSPRPERRPPPLITLLDPKRSLNVNIFLKQFRSTCEDIASLVRRGAYEEIGAERLRGLLAIIPEAEEVEMLRSQRHARERLAPAERFLLTLLEVSQYRLRVECLVLRAEWASAAGCLRGASGAVLRAARTLLSCKKLQDVLYLALVAGNFLNAGGYAAGAAGVRLASLAKLADIRANKPGLTLLHYVAMQVERQHPDDEQGWSTEWRTMEEAARYPLEQLAAESTALLQRVQKLKDQLRRQDTPTDLREQTEDFLTEAEHEAMDLQSDVKEVEVARKSLAEYFCEDVESFKLEDCFKVFAGFCGKLHSAALDNARRRAHEENAAARRRARDSSAPPAPVTTTINAPAPVAECEALMESLLVDIRNGLGRRSLRRGGPARESSPAPSPCPSPLPQDARDSASWGSLDRWWSRKRLEIPERERPRPPSITLSPSPTPAPAQSPAPVPKEWKQKIESWLRSGSGTSSGPREQREQRAVEPPVRIITQHVDEIKDEKPKSPPAPAVEKCTKPIARSDIDADNLDSPPVPRRRTPPEPCRRLQSSMTYSPVPVSSSLVQMNQLANEILAEGQFDRFSPTRRSRRYRRPTQPSPPAETDLKDEGFEEASLTSESASQDASSGAGEPEHSQPSFPAPPPVHPSPSQASASRPPASGLTAPVPKPNCGRVERCGSRGSLRSSRSSLASAASISTVRKAPSRPTPRPTPIAQNKPAARPVPRAQAAAPPPSRSSSSGSSAGATRGARNAAGFMRPTQASRFRHHPTSTSNPATQPTSTVRRKI